MSGGTLFSVASGLLYSPLAVDLLAAMGLRDQNLPSSVAVVIEGPTDELDAFHLQMPLSASIDSKELELIGSLVSSQFGLYAVFNTVQYTGSIISITNGADSITNGADSTSLLDVSLEVSDAAPGVNTLTVSLQGKDYNFDLPVATSDSPFQAIGIKLMDSVLVVTLNCTILDFVILQSTSPPVTLANGTVSIFEEDAIVSLGRREYMYGGQFLKGSCNY